MKKVRGISLSKVDRFKIDLEEADEKDEILMPTYVKNIDREKVLFKMDKARDRFEKDLNADLEV